MPTLPTAEWTTALERMTVALYQSISDLERHQAEWTSLTETSTRATRHEALLELLERRLDKWDERLNAATELADSVEKQLEDREADVGRWHEVFVRWNELIQRKVG
jgi:hypothetical protein